MNASDNRFYREPGDRESAERELAEAIHREITASAHVQHALDLWRYAATDHPDWLARDVIRHVLAETAAMAINVVLARRQSEAARTGPWEGTP